MTNTQYSELWDFLVKHFGKIEGQISDLKIGQEIMKGQIADLQGDMVSVKGQITDLQEGQEIMKVQISNLQNTQDFVLGELKTLNEDKVVGVHRSRRVETWVIKAAKKINIPYNP